MLERLIILLVAALLVALAWLLLRWILALRLARLSQQPAANGLGAVLDGGDKATPTLLYFTTEECAQCRFQQAPILDRLATATTMPIVKINALESQDLASHYGILTVPSTVLLNAQRKPVAINHGLAHFEKLRLQIESLR
jgi:thioredoxin 1